MKKIEKVIAYYTENGMRDSIPLRDMTIVSQRRYIAGNYPQINIRKIENYSKEGNYILTGNVADDGWTLGIFPTLDRAKEVLQELIAAARDGAAIAYVPHV